MADSESTVLDAATFRGVLGNYPTGVCAVTAMVESAPVGMIVGSFTSVSLDPPLVAFMPDKASSTFAVLRQASSFTANILSSGQEDVCRRLASKTAADKWNGVAWHEAPAGGPILDDAVAWVSCDVETTYEGGDHWIVIGRVRHLGVQGNTLPLLFFQGAYGRFSPASFVARSEADLLSGPAMAEAVRDDLEELSRVTGLECTVAALVEREMVILARAGNFGGEKPRRPVGLRIPFVPPMGSPFAAWDEAAFELWVGQLRKAEEPVVELLRRQAARVRQRGWSVALQAPDYRQVQDLLADFTRGTYTPVAERRLRELIESLGDYFDPEEIDADLSYQLNSLRAPVFGPDGKIALNVVLIGPDRSVTGREIDQLRETLVQTTERMSEVLQRAAA